MKVSFFIARRYLFAKKSHNVINIISLISAIGIAIGTAALVIVMSVFNGFVDLGESLYRIFDSDLRITPVAGKVFVPQSLEFDQVRQLSGIISFAEVVEENVLLKYNDYQGVATIKGIDSAFLSTSNMSQAMFDGEFRPWFGELEQAIVGRGIAYKLGIGIHFVEPLHVYAPKREGTVSLTNLQASLVSDYIFPAGIFAIERTFDDNYLFTPIRFVRNLFDYTNEVSAIEIQLDKTANADKIQREIQKILGQNFVVKNRYEQQETMFRMYKTEKAVTYSILLFMLLIISCNALGSLAMIILEKRNDMFTLRSMGANDLLINRIFLFEGWLISLLGMVAGVVIGLLLAFAQKTFGLIAMPGNALVDSYPVSVYWTDIVLIVATVVGIGFLTAWLSVRYTRSK